MSPGANYLPIARDENYNRTYGTCTKRRLEDEKKKRIMIKLTNQNAR